MHSMVVWAPLQAEGMVAVLDHGMFAATLPAVVVGFATSHAVYEAIAPRL